MADIFHEDKWHGALLQGKQVQFSLPMIKLELLNENKNFGKLVFTIQSLTASILIRTGYEDTLSLSQVHVSLRPSFLSPPTQATEHS